MSHGGGYRKNHIDASQKENLPKLLDMGCSWHPNTGQGKGSPDGFLGYMGVTDPVEWKTGKASPNPNQVEWHRRWRGSPVVVLRDWDGCLALLEDMRRRARAQRLTPVVQPPRGPQPHP